MKHQEEDNNTLHSPKEIGDHLRVTSVPTYLLATAIILPWCIVTVTLPADSGWD